MVRQTDSGFGVDTQAGPGGPSSPEALLIRTLPHDLVMGGMAQGVPQVLHGWDLPCWLPAVYVYLCTCVRVCVYILVYICLCIPLCVYRCLHMYGYMCIYVHVYVCVCIYI